MSSRAIDENPNDLSSQLMPCCQPPKETPVLTAGTEELFPCCPSCSMDITAVTTTLPSEVPLNDVVNINSAGNYTLDAIVVTEGDTEPHLYIRITPLNELVITSIVAVGATVTPVPVTPFNVAAGVTFIIGLQLDTTTIGSFNLTAQIFTDCFNFTVSQDFEVEAI